MELILWPTTRDLVNLRPTDSLRTGSALPPGVSDDTEFLDAVKSVLWGAAEPQTQMSEALLHDSQLDREWLVSDHALELRKRFVRGLLKTARHDFHRKSQTHLFFGFYSQKAVIRAFDPYKDKAFACYIVLANRLAMASENERIAEWLAFIEADAADADNKRHANHRSVPCSGIVNVRVNPATEAALAELRQELTLSLNRICSQHLEKAIPAFKAVLRAKGVEQAGIEIRRFYKEAESLWKQHTLRVGPNNHALIIGLSRQLAVSVSAMASFLLDRYLMESWPVLGTIGRSVEWTEGS